MELYQEGEDDNNIDDNPWAPVYDKSNNFEFLATLNTKTPMMMKLPPGVNFINVIRMNFLFKHHFGSFFYVLVTR